MRRIVPSLRIGISDNLLFWSVVRRFLVRDEGQDIVEYALLAAFIGVAGVLVLNTMGATIFDTYSSWIDPAVGAPSIWDPAPPLTSGGGS